MGNGSLSRTVFLSCLFLFFNSFPLLSSAADRITQGQFIRDGETIISSGNDFALGFFSPGSSTNRYVGIWYNKIPIQTVVWVANRERPVSNSSGVLTIGTDGNLRLLDGSGTFIWSTNISSTPPINSTAILLDTGNLILSGDKVDDPDKALWQSFEDPGDTFLPGMRAGLNTRNGVTHLYSSWKSENDPSKGNFTLGVDPNGLPQIVIWENLKRRWRSGLWNGQVFIGVPDMRPRFLFGFKISDLGGRMYFTYTVLDDSDILRFHMKWDGTEEQLRWDDVKKEWFRFWSQPVSECQIYNKCGAFANCDMLNSQMCSCLRGFQPKSTAEWSRRNWSSGCVRKTELQCERNASAAKVKGDGFFQLNGVKLPDNSVWKTDYSNRNQCENYCLGNCSCKAYAFVSGIGCLTWGGDLVDIQQFQQNGNTLYLRLANSELGRKKTIAMWVIVTCVVLGVLILCISAYFLWRHKAYSRDSRRKSEKETIVVDVNKSREIWKDFSEKHDIGEGNEGSGADLPLLCFESLVTATNNFSDANMLGEGGFGSVYKGQVPGGKEVAVKRLSRMSGQGVEEFKNEIILIAKLQHRNLVRLLGCCIEGEEKLLVYEYLPNKSLDAFIFDLTMRAQLDWQKRFNILEGIARGLLYLHRDSRLRIIHRDLKASNILLDDEMNPKISDFGMAKIFGGSENQDNTNRVVGTYGYMAPEYAMEGLFSIKSDVYSFGVLLLEIISGKKNMKYCHPEYPLNLLGYVWKLWNEKRATDIIDACIRDSCPQGDVLRCIQVGLLCVQDSAMDRPTMSSVVLMLESEATVLPTPRQATFTIERSHVEMDLSIGSSETTSKNDVAGTMITGR